MTNITVKSLAAEIQVSVDYLVQQFANIGIFKSADGLVTTQEKTMLLSYIDRKHDLVPNKLILQRKTRSTLNISSSGKKKKLVQIEVRKLHTFLKFDEHELKTYAKGNQVFSEINEAKKSNEELKGEFGCQKPIGCVLKKINDEETDHVIKQMPLKHNCHDNGISELKEKIKEKECFNNNEMDTPPEDALSFFEERTWKNNVELIEDISNGRLTSFQKTGQVVHERKKEIDRRRNRNIKYSRSTRRYNKYFESKVDREEVYVTIRSNKGNTRRNSTLQQSFQKPTQLVNREVVIGETITIGELANKMAVKSSQVIKVMMQLGAMVTINQIIDQKTAQLVAEAMGHKVILRHENELETMVMNDRDVGVSVEPRAPVVTVMGHVDHGKTSLLDYIRSTKIACDEAGGITQHIGAYHVETEDGMITFLDTPGHAAFTSMRARGAQITDIVVLVVAADDGVMPQTVEAIQHAKAAEAPIVVAVSKVDKSGADPNRVKNELTKYGIVSEEWGGDCQFVQISSKTGFGIDKLLNAILLQAEVLELQAVRNGMGRGVVIESSLDKGWGPIATVLIRTGTLNKGDIVLCGFEYGRIRTMRDERGHEIMHAGPSIPVEIVGLSGIPVAGDELIVVRDEKKAREVALYRQEKVREIKLASQQKIKIKNIFSNMVESKVREISIVLKADVQGSIGAISDALLKLSTNEVHIKIIGSGVGAITETDAMLAVASNAILIGFNVRENTSARRVVEETGLDLRFYSVIYTLIDEIKAKMNGVLSHELKQQIIGFAEVRDVFKSKKFGFIAGCMVIEGIIKKHNPIRILRERVVIYEGELESLRRFKDNVNEVRNGMECGIGVKNYNDIQVGDVIEVFKFVKVKCGVN